MGSEKTEFLWFMPGKYVCSVHILAGCFYVLGTENGNPKVEDRYTWRHNNVLNVFRTFLVVLIMEMNSVEVVEKKDEGIVRRQPFVEEGKTPRFQKAEKKSRRVSILAQANDWQWDFDLPRKDGQYRFPMEVCPEAGESVNPDGYIFSKKPCNNIRGH